MERFRRLINRAESIFEIDGNRSNLAMAYQSCSRIVISQSDLLVIIWDGKREGKIGGTEDALDKTLEQGVPVILVDAKNPHGCQILDEAVNTDPGKVKTNSKVSDADVHRAIESLVNHLIALPGPTPDQMPVKLSRLRRLLKPIYRFQTKSLAPEIAYQDFLNEKNVKFNYGLPWKVFTGLIGNLKLPSINFKIEKVKVKPTGTPKAFPDTYYAWPDTLAVWFGDAYHSAFLVSYLLAAAAVGMALLPIAFGFASAPSHIGETIFIYLELFIICIMLTIVLAGRWKRWHERWLDYRLAVELIRHIHLVSPLGGEQQRPPLPAHLAGYSHPGMSWVAWYSRAVEREQTLPSVNMSTAYLKECLSNIKQLLEDQIGFHYETGRRNHRIEHRLHMICIILLIGTIAAGVSHYLHIVSDVMTAFCGILPALGASLEGINNQGEFKRVGKRSESMTNALDALKARAARLESFLDGDPRDNETPISQQIASLANESARLMVSEVLDWRVIFLDRPLNPTQ